MQVLYSALASLLIGYLFSKASLFRLKKLEANKYFLFSVAWFVSVVGINLLYHPDLFYSNDQLIFKEALISFEKWLFRGGESFDIRYLGQTGLALILYKFLLFDPLVSLKAINFFCMVFIFRIFYDFIDKLENVSILNFQVRLILPFLLGPSFILFSAIGNRDIIIILVFLVTVLAIYRKKRVFYLF